MPCRIGSFNCLNYGRKSTKNTGIFADIIRKERFDIVALQEIRAREVLDSLVMYMGQNWKYEFSAETCEYAFLWNSNRVELPTSTVGESNIVRVNKPRIFKQYKKNKQQGQINLRNDPYYARFILKFDGGYTEIRLLNTHIRFSKGITESQLGEMALRRNEFSLLTETIYPKAANKRYGNMIPAYTILLGDYNMNLKSSLAPSPYIYDDEIVISDGDRQQIIATVQSELTTLANTDIHNVTETNRYVNNYDHASYDKNRYTGVSVNVSCINAVEKYCGGDFEKYRKYVSDHLPICIEINLKS